MINKVEKVLSKHDFILAKLKKERIFGINVADTDVYVVEECDEWFGYQLDKQDCLKISEVFSDLAKCFDDNAEI